MKKLLLFVTTAFLLVSCFDPPRDTNAIDYYDYILHAPEYAYKQTKPVEVVTQITPPEFGSQFQWRFQQYVDDSSFTGNYQHYLNIVDTVNDSTLYIEYTKNGVQFLSAEHQLDYVTDTVILSKGFPQKEIKYFPLPHGKEITSYTRFYKMDDGSYCYRDSYMNIYSSTLGLLAADYSTADSKEYQTVVQQHGSVSIPHIIREFIAKEKYYAQQ